MAADTQTEIPSAATATTNGTITSAKTNGSTQSNGTTMNGNAAVPELPSSEALLKDTPATAPTKTPALTLSVPSRMEEPSFPSPSSTFVPPPVAGKHEFALVLPRPGSGAGRKRAGSVAANSPLAASGKEPEKEKEKDLAGLEEEAGKAKIVKEEEAPTPIASASPAIPPVRVKTTGLGLGGGQGTPTPSTLTPIVSTTIIIPPSLGTPTIGTPTTPHRPAPPSPAVSRRTSGVPMGTMSRAGSLRRPAGMSKRDSYLSTASSSAAPATPPPPKLILIRDYGFPESDERFSGLGPSVPRANRYRLYNRASKHMSTGSISESSEAAWDEDEGDGWASFKWGMGRFSMGMAEPAATMGMGELDMNFAGQGDDEEEEEYHDANEEYHEGEEGEEGEDQSPLLPGLYRALYAFEPEGTAEAALEEDQIVRVVGRGGGVGWAVIVTTLPYADGQDGAGVPGHGLVPEGYLEVLELDPSP